MKVKKVRVAECGLLIAIISLILFYAIYGAQTARLSVTIVDGASGRPTPVRVRLTDADGRSAPLPDATISIMYGRNDRAEGYGFQPDSSFYVDGSFEVELRSGIYHLSLSKGYEYLTQHHQIHLKASDEVSRTYQLERWINMPVLGWYSADDHIHIRRSPRENPLILKWIAAEDIHIGALLRMGDFWRTYYAQYAWGRDGLYQEKDYVLSSGQEGDRCPMQRRGFTGGPYYTSVCNG